MIQNYDCSFGLRRMSENLFNFAKKENQRFYELLFERLSKPGYVISEGMKLGREWILGMLERLSEESQEMAWESQSTKSETGGN